MARARRGRRVDLKVGDVVLCEFYFSDLGARKHRPVIVFRDNLPFEDFVGVPVSSQTATLHDDEFILEPTELAEGSFPSVRKSWSERHS